MPNSGFRVKVFEIRVSSGEAALARPAASLWTVWRRPLMLPSSLKHLFETPEIRLPAPLPRAPKLSAHIPGLGCFPSAKCSNSGIFLSCHHYSHHALHLLSASSTKETSCIRGHPLTRAADELLMVAGNRFVRFSMENLRVVKTFVDFSGRIGFFDMSSSGKWVAYGYQALLIVKHVATGLRWKPKTGWGSDVTFRSVRFSRNETALHCVGASYRIYEIPDRDAVKAASAADDGGMSSGKLKEKQQISLPSSRGNSISFSLDGNLAAIATDVGGLCIYDVGLRPVRFACSLLTTPTVTYAEFSPLYESRMSILFFGDFSISLAEVLVDGEYEDAVYSIKLRRDIRLPGSCISAKFHPTLPDVYAFIVKNVRDDPDDSRGLYVCSFAGSAETLGRLTWVDERHRPIDFCFTGECGERLCFGSTMKGGLYEVFVNTAGAGDEGEEERAAYVAGLESTGRIEVQILQNRVGSDRLTIKPKVMVLCGQ